jgi:hypothetical protein
MKKTSILIMKKHPINRLMPSSGATAAGSLILASLLTGCHNQGASDKMPDRPNIIWIVAEDMSDHWGCYGEKTIATPHIDKLAQEGVLFERAFVTAPVCSPCRSALITGMYQPSIGAHNHRSQVREGNGGGNSRLFR